MTNSISNTAPDLATALEALQRCRAQLRSAHAEALAAIPNLAGARRTRAVELVEKVGDAAAHCERMVFVVFGDLRCPDYR
jgi:hypothetical protein